MKKNLWLWQLSGFTFAVVLGSLLHFLYEWTDFLLFAPISAVNESTWEHMKILFFPMLAFACIQAKFFSEEYVGFWWIKLIGVLAGVASIPVLFYTCSGAFGKTPDWLNVIFFFASAGGAYMLEWALFCKKVSWRFWWIAVTVLLVIATLFIMFTFFPPQLPLFQDPIRRSYGLVLIR